MNVVHDDRARGAVDQIDHIIECFRHQVNVFAIKRRNERLIQTRRHVVGQIVAGMFDALDALNVFLIITIAMGHHLYERLGRVVYVGSHLREQ